VRTARDGFEALAVLRGSIPDELVSDLRMPNMSGFELLANRRQHSERQFESSCLCRQYAFNANRAGLASRFILTSQKAGSSDCSCETIQ
jgi:CheY-like chemotaxis protein